MGLFFPSFSCQAFVSEYTLLVLQACRINTQRSRSIHQATTFHEHVSILQPAHHRTQYLHLPIWSNSHQQRNIFEPDRPAMRLVTPAIIMRPVLFPQSSWVSANENLAAVVSGFQTTFAATGITLTCDTCSGVNDDLRNAFGEIIGSWVVAGIVGRLRRSTANCTSLQQTFFIIPCHPRVWQARRAQTLTGTRPYLADRRTFSLRWQLRRHHGLHLARGSTYPCLAKLSRYPTSTSLSCCIIVFT
jgi:hypothetical protein